MHRFIVILTAAVAAVSAMPLDAAASCDPPNCSSVCPLAQTIYKTRTTTVKTTTCTTKTKYTQTVTDASTVTTTLSPGCPTSTAVKRAASSVSSSSSSSKSSTSPIACPTYTCGCPSPTAKTTATTTTTVTKTKTKTETVKTETTIQSTATSTPAVFYLQSTFDNGIAHNDEDQNIVFSTICSSYSTLYALNTTASQLYLPSNGYIATNVDCCGSSGLPVAFSDPSTLEQGATALSCNIVNGDMLEFGLFGTTRDTQECYGQLLLGASHLCDYTTVRVVTPVFS